MHLSIDKDLLKSLLIMADVIEARDPYTGGHVWRVSHISKILTLKAGLSNDEALHISIGAYLHDLGKVGIPDAVLRKPEKLTDPEFEIIKTHPIIGANLLNEHPLGELVLDIILHHHERLDGEGYPHRADGSTLSMDAKIVALADAFDALTSSRPYRKGIKIAEALTILSKGSGSQFDPSLVAALQTLSDDPELTHIVGHSDEGIPLIDCPACGTVFSISRKTREGDIAFCRACTAKHVMHQDSGSFRAEFTGTTGSPQELQPKPNLEVIRDFIQRIPKVLTISKPNNTVRNKPAFFHRLLNRSK